MRRRNAPPAGAFEAPGGACFVSDFGQQLCQWYRI